MATSTMYDHARYLMATGALGNLSTAGRLKMLLLSSNTAIVQAAATLAAALAGATELSGAAGYSRATLASISVTEDNTNHWARVTSAAAQWTDTDGNLQAYRAILYYDPTGSSADSACIPLCHILLNDNQSIANPDPNGTLTITPSANGWFTV